MLAQATTRETSRRRTTAFWQKRGERLVIYLLTIALGVFFMLPFLWTLSSALKPVSELYLFPPQWLPKHWQPDNFVRIWILVPFARWTLNTAIVTLLTVIGSVISSSIVAYGFARYRFFMRDFIFLVLLSTMMIPIYITIIPRFLMFRQIGWMDTLKPLFVPAFFGGGAFNIFLLRQFFMTLPRDFDEAAYVDGANSLTIFTRIILPLSKPALSVVAIFGFVGAWNDFMDPLIYLNTTEKFTLSLGITWFRNLPMEAGEPKDHLLMAASITTTLPLVIAFFAAQRYFIAGIVTGGLKG